MTLLLNAVQDGLTGAADWIVIALVACHLGPVLTWQVVGFVRSAGMHLRDGGDVFLTWGGYAMVLIVISMTLSQSVGSILSLRFFQAESVEITAPANLPVSADGQTVFLAGDIDYHSRDALLRTLVLHSKVRRVLLDSDGGLVFAARTVAEIILKRGLDTHVERQCNSACTLVFAAGQSRTMDTEAALGFHAYGKSSKFHLLSVDADAEQAKDADFLRQRGVSDAFLAQIYEHGIDTLWRPDRTTLLKAGLLTAP